MLKLEYKGYVIYFTSACLVEDFHVHVNKPKPIRSGAAKLWLSKDRCLIADRGKFSERELNEIYTRFLRKNVDAFMKDWSSYTKLTVYVDLR